MVIIENEIATNKVLLRKLKAIKVYYEKKVTQNKEDLIFKEKIVKLIETTEKAIEDLKENKDSELYQLKAYFFDLINELKRENAINETRTKPAYIDIKKYTERAYAKLNYVFRKSPIMSFDEAKEYYSKPNILHEKWSNFNELINWLNDNGINIVCEKVLFSGWLSISVETYNELCNNGDLSIRNVFKNIDEGLTTAQFGSLISNDRKSLERIQKTETYGQEMRETQDIINTQNNNLVLSFDDIMKRKNSILGNTKTETIDYKG